MSEWRVMTEEGLCPSSVCFLAEEPWHSAGESWNEVLVWWEVKNADHWFWLMWAHVSFQLAQARILCCPAVMSLKSVWPNDSLWWWWWWCQRLTKVGTNTHRHTGFPIRKWCINNLDLSITLTQQGFRGMLCLCLQWELNEKGPAGLMLICVWASLDIKYHS